MRAASKPFWNRLRDVGPPFFTSEARSPALAWVGLLVALLLGVNGLNVLNSYVFGDFMTALEQRELRRFYLTGGGLAAVFAVLTLVAATARYSEQRLGLLWREWLTRRLLDRYLHGRTYRRLEGQTVIDNPDQRITEDVKTFTTETLSFLVLLVNACMTLMAFAGVLWQLQPWLFLAAGVYAALGSLGTLLLGRRLPGLNNLQFQKEADFRHALVQLRDNAHAVAQSGGEPAERARLRGRLGAVVDNFRHILGVNLGVGFFTTGYNYVAPVIPVLLVAPLYVRGRIPFGAVSTATIAFTQVLGAFSLIISQFQELSRFAAVVNRLGGLWEATEPSPVVAAEARAPAPEAAPAGRLLVERVPNGRRVAYQGVTLWVARTGRVLVRDLTLEIPEGRRLMITGPNGAGKTAILHAGVGLWEWGEGRVERAADGVCLVPQVPYARPGRLRELLQYGDCGAAVSDDLLREAVEEVGLWPLAHKVGGLDAECDWFEVLSAGELHMAALARLLVARPRFAFLDDLAAGLDAASLDRLYAALARTSITYVSAGNEPDLGQYHEQQLVLHGDGTWHLEPARTPARVDNGAR